MKKILLMLLLFGIFSCSNFKKNHPIERNSFNLESQYHEDKSKFISFKRSDASSNFKVLKITSQDFHIFLEDAIPLKEGPFYLTLNQLLQKIYNDKIQNTPLISIESGIDYVLFSGFQNRYKASIKKNTGNQITEIYLTVF